MGLWDSIIQQVQQQQSPTVGVAPVAGTPRPAMQPTTPIYGAINQAYGGQPGGYQNYLNAFNAMLRPAQTPRQAPVAPTRSLVGNPAPTAPEIPQALLRSPWFSQFNGG